MAGFEQRGKGPQANVECWWPLEAQKAMKGILPLESAKQTSSANNLILSW